MRARARPHPGRAAQARLTVEAPEQQPVPLADPYASPARRAGRVREGAAAARCLRWATGFLPSPADPSQPLVLSDEQARFVVGWYEADATGVYVYRRGAIEMPKGWGK